MQPKLNEQDAEQVNTEFRSRILRVVLYGQKEVDSRTVIGVQRKGLLLEAEKVRKSDLSPELVEDDQHPDRIAAPPGPLLFYVVHAEPPEHAVIAITELLLSSSPEIRAAALEYLDRWKGLDQFQLTPRTAKGIDNFRGKLTDHNDWREAALAISDALTDDILANLAGLRQSLAMNFDAGAEQYGRIVLRPTVSSLDSIDLRNWQPSAQRAQIESDVRALAGVSSASALFREYYAKFGHLPLDRSLSVALALDQLVSTQTAPGSIWHEIWEAAKAIDSPYAQYHACLLFLELPDLVPADACQAVWTEIVQIVTASIPEERTESAKWVPRLTLAQHYYNYLACFLPGSNSERLAVFSSWIADRVAQVFLSGGELTDSLSERVMDPIFRASEATRKLTHPPLEPSRLAHATANFKNPWSFALQCQLPGNAGPEIGKLMSPQAMSEKTPVAQSPVDEGQDLFAEDRLGKHISGSAMSLFWFTLSEVPEPVYGFDRSILAAADAWGSVTPTPRVKDFIAELLPAVNQIQEPTNLIEAIRRLPVVPEHEQVLTASALPSLLTKGPEVLDKLWAQLLDQQWRESLLFNVPPHIVSAVSGIWIELAVRHGDKWRNHLPHLIAVASEKTDDPARRDLLFTIQLTLSVAGSTDSAIRRIRRGERRADFSAVTESWRLRLDNLSLMASPWAKSKIRSVMGALSAP